MTKKYRGTIYRSVSFPWEPTQQRTWKYDGGDFLTGNQMFDQNDRPRGPGGLISWHVNPWHFKAHAWTKNEDFDFKRQFKTEEAAKRAVERWLADKGFEP